jgi:hypothetical protein
MVWVSHVGIDYATRDLASMRIAPRNAPRPDVGAELDETPSSEVIEIELEAILQANSVSRARHMYTAILIAAILPQTRYEKV